MLHSRSGPGVQATQPSYPVSLALKRTVSSSLSWILCLILAMISICGYSLTSVVGSVSAHSATRTTITHTLRPNISASSPFDGLGDLSFYTYVTLPLNDRLDLKVNVANGNLLVHSHDLSVHGRGIDLNIDSYYNSLPSYNYYMYEHGSNWTSNLCSTQYLDTHSNPSVGISFFGPSNFSAFFARNSDGSYKDAPGLNATLKSNGDSTYTLTYHQTGERVIFGVDTSVEKIEDKNNNTISCSYDNTSRKTTESLTDTQGRKVSFLHNGNLISQLSDVTGRTVGYGYDGNNNLTSITDLLNKRTSFGYNGHDLTSITDPLNHTTSISYLTGDKAGTITDATGNGTISFTYNNGNTVVKDQNGHSTTYTYNSSLQVTQTTDALDHSSTKKFDALNYNVTQYGDALSDFSNFVFSTDGRNNLNSISDGNGAATTFGYPTSGTNNLYYPLWQKDPQNNTTNYAYDTNGNLLSATDQKSGSKLTYTYNPDGTPATGKDARNNLTSYGYDSNGNLTSVTQPAPLGKITLTVDALSRVSSVTDGKNQKTSYTYDNLDRVTKITYNDSSAITYVYDDNSNLTSMTDNTGTTTFTYDVLNRLTKKQLPDHSQINTTFDKIGNLTSYNDGSTGTVNYAYDAANRVTTLTEPDNAQTTYTYDNGNRNTAIHYPNNTGMLMTYDAAGHELTAIGGVLNAQNQVTTTYSNFRYTYTSGSNHTSLLQSVSLLDPIGQSATYHRQYTYDSQNRLTDAAIFNSSNTQVDDFSYGYDANSNLTSSNVWSQGASVSYNYNTANELTSRTQGTTTTNYTYDANGNAASWSNGPSTSYNVKNQATSAGSDSYTYSGPTQSDRVTLNSNTFTYGGLGLTKEVNPSGTTDFIRNSNGLLVSDHTPDGKKYYYLFDGLGSVVGMTDSNGNDVNRYDYDPYGNMLHQQERSGLSNPWKYAGGYFDSTTNLYKFGIRYYDASTGRWTQRTPVGGSLAETTKANPYVYTNDNPINEVDPGGAYTLPNVSTQHYGAFSVTHLDTAGVAVAAGAMAIVAAFAPPAAPVLAVYGGLMGIAAGLSSHGDVNIIQGPVIPPVILPGS